MTVLLILFTLVLFLTADYFVQRRERRVRVLAFQPVHGPGFPYHTIPEATALASNHTWVRRDPDGSSVIGVDDFLGRLIGSIEEIVLPEPGSSLVPVRNEITLKASGRALKLAAPVQGRVVEVNEEVFRNPSLARTDPYGRGWLLRMRPASDARVSSNPFIVRNPIEWLAEQNDLAARFFSSFTLNPQLVTMQDGGLPVEGLLQSYDDEVWTSFQSTFASLNPVKKETVQ